MLCRRQLCALSNHDLDLVLCRRQLCASEDVIRQRSRAAENKWSCDKWQQSSAGLTTARLLTIALDALDRHSFDRMDSNNSLDTLYAKIFAALPPPKSGGNGGNAGEIKPVVVSGVNDMTIRTLLYLSW